MRPPGEWIWTESLAPQSHAHFVEPPEVRLDAVTTSDVEGGHASLEAA